MDEKRGEGAVAIRPFEVTSRQVFAIAAPMSVAFLTTPLLGIVDTVVIGQFGDPALLGGLAAGAIVFDVVLTTFNFLRSGTTGLVAQAFGRDDKLEQQAVLARALLLAVLSGVLLILLGSLIATAGVWFIDPEPRVGEAMTQYVLIRMLAAPLTLANYAILGYALGRGESFLGLFLQVILNGANIVLSIVLGLHLGWGLEGVAWGTVGGEVLGAAVGAAILVRRFRPEVKVSWQRIRERGEILRMIAMNGDIMLRSFALLAAFALFTRQGAQFGTVTLAANAVLMNAFLLAGYFLDGIATAAEQLSGRSVGARYTPAFYRTVRLTALWGFLLALGLTFLSLWYGDSFIAFAVKDEAVRLEAGRYLPWAALVGISGVLAFQMDGIYIGATWSRDMRNMMLLSLLIYAASMVVLTAQWGNHGLWASLHIFLLFRGFSLSLILPRRARETFG